MAVATPVSTHSESRRTIALPEPAPAAAVAVSIDDEGRVAVNVHALRYHSFAYFFSEVHDDQDHSLIVEGHHEEWCDLFQYEPLLVLMAPRDHGKTFCAVCYVLWKAYRHNRDPETGALYVDRREGTYEAVIFSETLEQAGKFFELLQSLFLSNTRLFGDIAPDLRMTRGQLRDVWSRRRMRLRNGFEAKIRAFRTSTRGLHPDLLLLDDVLSDQNTLTAYQRNKSWTYFVGTLMPMNAKEIKVVGTALHYDDLLHRLKPDKKKAPMMIQNRPVRFRWIKYRSVNWETGQVLWQGRHNLADLQGKRDLDALLFAREYQNDPRDDASSLFPFTLTQKALDAGKAYTFLKTYRKQANEYVVASLDIAISEEVAGDYTVCFVAIYNRETQTRRIIYAEREKGLSFVDQLNLLRRVCLMYGVDLGVVEDNGFQRWLRTEVQKFPETAGRLVGHRTGREKGSLVDGVPSLKLGLLQQLWVMPSGDEESLTFARIWQSEMSAFGWKDEKLQGVGEHDDTVMSFWLLDRAIRLIEEWIAQGPQEEVIMGTEVGISPVRISADY